MVRVSYGAALFDSCSFTNLAAPEVDADDYSYVYQYKSRTGAIDAHGANATVALRNCAVADIAAERPATVRDDASIFSSDPDLTVRFCVRLPTSRCGIMPVALQNVRHVVCSLMAAGGHGSCSEDCRQTRLLH